ncbi:MAG TPA: hypothetical protein VK190_04430 [Pseudoneobacillus sp.]|nr:hypothetical protein [Pseudoneobacillus sp.]
MSEINNQDLLKALLAPQNDEVKKSVPMKRFGIDFVIKALSPDEATKITQRATRLGSKGQKIFDEEMFNYLSIAKACVVPNWEDENLISALGAADAVDAIKKRLLFGEVTYLLQEIGEINGFDKSDDEMIQEIKN